MCFGRRLAVPMSKAVEVTDDDRRSAPEEMIIRLERLEHGANVTRARKRPNCQEMECQRSGDPGGKGRVVERCAHRAAAHGEREVSHNRDTVGRFAARPHDTSFGDTRRGLCALLEYGDVGPERRQLLSALQATT